MPIKQFAKKLMPPLLLDAARALRPAGPPEWEYVPQGWRALQTDPNIKGWNVAAVLEANKARWSDFLKTLEGTQPFGKSPEAGEETPANIVHHNLIMSYGYSLAVAAHCKTTLSLLDWGGGIGHYYPLSRALLPSVKIDYHGYDIPMIADYARTLFPDAHFYSDDSYLSRRYDFVLASSALHYVEDWPATLAKLAGVTRGWLYLTRLPTVFKVPSYVMVQRAYQYGYDTEYLGWCVNRGELLHHTEAAGLELIREFMVEIAPEIRGAPEPCVYGGYLFRAAGATDREDAS